MGADQEAADLLATMQEMSIAGCSNSREESQGHSLHPEIKGGTSSIGEPNAEPDPTYIPFRAVENDTTRYQPLDPTSKDIRCIIIHPSGDQGADAPLVCILTHTSLTNANHTKYAALSYCWGPVSDTVPITVVHRAKDMGTQEDAVQQYHVTRNLDSALRAFRHETKYHVLWVDAICINQHDSAERSAQVSFMRQIYAASTKVIVWLGEADEAIQFLFRMVRFYGSAGDPFDFGRRKRKATRPQGSTSDDSDKKSELSKNDPEQDGQAVAASTTGAKQADEDSLAQRRDGTTSHDTAEEDEEEEGGEEDGTMSDPNDHLGMQHYMHQCLIRDMIRKDADMWVLALSSVLSRPWFNRVWVIQEVFCGVVEGSGQLPKVPRHTKALLIAGSTHCSFDEFCRFIEDFGHTISANQATSRYPTFTPLKHFQTQWISHWDAWSLELGITELMASCQGFQATDSRDKLFALLALAWDAGAPVKEPNDALIQPDYCKTPSQVSVDFVQWQIGFKQDLQLFGCTRKSLNDTASSWAPDVLTAGAFELWFDIHESVPHEYSLAVANADGSTSGLHDTGEISPVTGITVPKITFQGSTLRVMGNIVSRVDKPAAGEVCAVRYERSGAIRLLLRWGSEETEEMDLFVFLNAVTRDYADEPSDAERLMKTLCMFAMCRRDDANYDYRPEEVQAYLDESHTSHTMNDRLVPFSAPESAESAAPAEEEKRNPFLHDPVMDKKEKEQNRCPFWLSVTTQGAARSFFVTDTGELGLGPKNLPLRPDDVVVALDTAKFPHILRPCPEPELEGKFRLVGACSFYDQQYMSHAKYQATAERPVRLFEIV